jgi:two-component system response regulator HydG
MSSQDRAGQSWRGRLIGNSRSSQKLSRSICRTAPFNSTVLITGPSGTGKELVAQAIHASSPRGSELFIPVDCTSLTGDLMASQLFGHVKGAFTSADQGSLGCFRAAHRGTIFLDEIGELPLPLQCKLLRVIQERAVVPVGSHAPIGIDVRILAATNRDLYEEVQAGRFRADLYYRLSVITISIAPLCERPDDIALMVPAFLAELESQGHPRQSLTPEALEMLQSYDWPGNVRELKNVLEQAAIESDSELITAHVVAEVLAVARRAWKPPSDLTSACFQPVGLSRADRFDQDSLFSTPDANWPQLADVERRLILSTLEHTRQNKSAAARLLAISRQALLRKMIRLRISF